MAFAWVLPQPAPAAKGQNKHGAVPGPAPVEANARRPMNERVALVTVGGDLGPRHSATAAPHQKY